ncbi:MAG: DUF2178 domain-containing protein [archaeon]|nr:DUF2178 domain-containing protein [archaeon]
MKFRKDRDILRFSCIAVLLILAGILMISFLSSPVYFRIGFALIITGIMAIIVAIITAARPKEDLIQDERSVRVNEKAGYHAFWILLLTMGLLQTAGIIWRLDLNFKDVIPNLFVVGIWSWIIRKWYYNRRGDVR